MCPFKLCTQRTRDADCEERKTKYKKKTTKNGKSMTLLVIHTSVASPSFARAAAKFTFDLCAMFLATFTYAWMSRFRWRLMLGKRTRTGERKIARNQFIRKVLHCNGSGRRQRFITNQQQPEVTDGEGWGFASCNGNNWKFDWLRRPIDGRTCI